MNNNHAAGVLMESFYLITIQLFALPQALSESANILVNLCSTWASAFDMSANKPILYITHHVTRYNRTHAHI